MRALVLNCTLTSSPTPSNSRVLADVVIEALRDNTGDIALMATPTWLEQPSSAAKLALERMDAMISKTKDDGTYAAYNKIAGVVVTGQAQSSFCGGRHQHLRLDRTRCI